MAKLTGSFKHIESGEDIDFTEVVYEPEADYYLVKGNDGGFYYLHSNSEVEDTYTGRLAGFYSTHPEQDAVRAFESSLRSLAIEQSGQVGIWFDDAACTDAGLVGGKGASLAHMVQDGGFPIPPGFVVPASVFEASIDTNELARLTRKGDGEQAMRLIASSEPPEQAILAMYRERMGDSRVVVRSSALTEDSGDASYAGQLASVTSQKHMTELAAHFGLTLKQRYTDDTPGVPPENIAEAVKIVWMSGFTSHALGYRARQNQMDNLGVAVVIQEVVPALKAGTIFTQAGNKGEAANRMKIDAVPGMGENYVSGQMDPDHYMVGRDGQLAYARLIHGGLLDPDEVQTLVELGLKAEKYFGNARDNEWAADDRGIFIVQSRPITTIKNIVDIDLPPLGENA